MSNGDDRAFGRLEADVENLQREMGELRKDVKKLVDGFNQAKGGWKTLLLVAGVAGTMGALTTKLLAIWPLGK